MKLSFSDFGVLEALLHKGPLPVNTIGRKVLLTSGSITSAIDRLGERRLVRRARCKEDARVIYVSLTAKGRQLIKKAFSTHTLQLNRAAAILSLRERRTLVELLKKLGKSVESSLNL